MKSGMSTYAFGRPCSECGTESGFIDWCRICRYADAWGLSPDWILLFLAYFVIFAWALKFERLRLDWIKQLVAALRPKMPGFHKFRIVYRRRMWLLLAQVLLATLTQACINWIEKPEIPIWALRWVGVFWALVLALHVQVFFSQPFFYCQDPAKVQQSIVAASADGPFYLYQGDWTRYPTLEALIETLKPKSQ